MVHRTVIYSSGPYFAKGFLWRFRGEGCFTSAAASGLGILGGLGRGKPSPVLPPLACMTIRPDNSYGQRQSPTVQAGLCVTMHIADRPDSSQLCSLDSSQHRRTLHATTAKHGLLHFHQPVLWDRRHDKGLRQPLPIILQACTCRSRAGHRPNMELTLLPGFLPP